MPRNTRTIGSLLLSWEALEEKPVGFFNYVIVLAAIMFTRNVLEAFSGTGFTEQAGSYLIHYPLAYIAPLLALSSALAVLSGVPVIRVTRLMLYVWLLTLLPPLLDLLITRGIEGESTQIGYLALSEGEYWSTFLNFFNPSASLKGTTIGIRIEAFLASVLSMMYVAVKSKSPVRTVVAPFVIFALSYFFFTFPHVYLWIVKLFDRDIAGFPDLFLTEGMLIRTDTARLSLIVAQVDIVLTALVLLIWYGLYRGRQALSRTAELVLSPPAVYSAVVVFSGFIIGWRVILPYDPLPVLLSHHSDFMSLVSLILAAVGASAGIAFSERSTQGREDPRAGLPRNELLFVLFTFAALNTLVIGFAPFCFLLLYTSASLFRSCPPFRLKNHPPLSALALALATIALLGMSYSLFAGSRVPAYFPRELLAVVFLSLTIGGFAVSLSEREAGREPKRLVHVISALLLIAAYLIPATLFRNAPFVAATVVAAALSAAAVFLPGRRLTTGIIFAAYLPLVLTISSGDLRALGSRTWGTPRQIEHAELAAMYRSEGRHEHARIEYEKAVELGSLDPDVYFELGFEYTREGDELMAIDLFRRATQLDSTYGEAYYNLGLAYMRTEQEEEAVRTFVKALRLLPEREEVQFTATAYLIDHGYIDRALAGLRDPQSLSELDQRLFFATLQRIAEQPEAAEAIDAGNRYASIVEEFSRAMEKGAGGDTGEMVRRLASLRNDYPSLHAFDYYWAWAMQTAGNYEQAIAGYRRFLSKLPGVYQAQINLGAAYTSTGRLDEARAVLEEVLTERPDDIRALVNLANTYTREGNLDVSFELLSRALELAPDDYLVRMNLGIVLEGLSRNEEAIVQYRTIMLAHGESPELHMRIAGCYQRLGNVTEAARHLERALSLDPDYEPALKALGALRQEP